MFWPYILAIFRESQVWCGTVESHAAYSSSVETLAALFSVLKSSFFVELHVSLCIVKLCSLTKSGATMGAMCTNVLQSCGTHAGSWCFLITCGVITSPIVRRAPVCC